MTNVIHVDFNRDKRGARRAQFDSRDPDISGPVIAEALAQQNADVAAQHQRDQDLIGAALRRPPQRWPELAAWVDEGTWQRILSEMPAQQRAALEAIRPAAGPAPRLPVA